MIFEVDFKSFKDSVPLISEKSGLAEKIKDQNLIVIKPNLTLNKIPPTTTSVKLVEAVILFCKKNGGAKIVVAEGSGGCPTKEAFAGLGYTKMAEEQKIELLDLNHAERIELKNNDALKLKKVRLPKILKESFLINIPVLKEHDQIKVTCVMKNLVGIYQKKNFFPQRLPWSKMDLHIIGLNESIFDLNNYIKSDFVLVDASVGQKGNEVNGYPCDPPIGKLFAGFEAREVDEHSLKYLGHKKEDIKYLNY